MLCDRISKTMCSTWLGALEIPMDIYVCKTNIFFRA